MDKNQVTGWVLIVLIVIGFVYFQSKSAEELAIETAAQQELADKANEAEQSQDTVASSTTSQTVNATPARASASPTDTANSNSQLDSLKEVIIQQQLQSQFGIFTSAVQGEDEEIILENQKLRLYINTKGAYITKAIVKDYRNYADYHDNVDGELVLFSGDSSYYQINFQHQGRVLNTRDFYFTPTATDGLIVTSDSGQVSLKLKLLSSNGGYIEYVYTLKGNDYMLDFDVNIVNLDRDITGANKALEFEWEQITPQQEKSLELERQNATIFYYSDDDGRDYLNERSNFKTETPEEALNWISFKQQYFSTLLLSKNSKITGANLEVQYNEEDTTYVKHFGTTFPIEMSSNVSNKYGLFMGPNDYDLLKSYDQKLESELNLGWGIFGWVNKYFIYPVFQWLLSAGLGIGIAIILLTFSIKLVLFPITYKNFLSSAKMRVIKPHLEKLNEEHKDADPMKKQQATMALYKKTGVSPLAGCIPALLQMPILIALYRLFPTAIELRHQSFLWADDLSSYDSILELPFEIPFYGSHVSLFTILMAVSMFFYMKYNQQMTPTAASSGGGDMQAAIQKNMKVMMNFMPVMMLFMFNGFAAGLSFYYFLANVITIGQTLVIK
ncbi:MAG: YidC/Oxa1 family membrane protein insertase, partial [Saprospiraceae bacterium]